MNSAPLLPKKIVRSLLATTSLTAITAAGAHAGTITESIDFGDTFNSAAVLPVGTTRVFGSLDFTEGGGDRNDWFEFSSLVAGRSFSVAAEYNPAGVEGRFRINLYDSTGTLVPYASVSRTGPWGPTLEGGGTVITGTVPNGGNLFADVFGPFSSEGSHGYRVDLTAAQSTVPEPGTSTTLGLGLAAVAAGVAWRKRRSAVPSLSSTGL